MESPPPSASRSPVRAVSIPTASEAGTGPDRPQDTLTHPHLKPCHSCRMVTQRYYSLSLYRYVLSTLRGGAS